MSETIEIILFMLGGVFTCIAAGATAHINLLGKISEIRERLIAIEVKDEMQSRKSAKMMHSPHNPYGMDALIDKYLDRHYELSMEEWKEWAKRCEKVIDNANAPREDRVLATQLLCVCYHKLMMPTPFRKLVEGIANKVEDKVEAKMISL